MLPYALRRFSAWFVCISPLALLAFAAPAPARGDDLPGPAFDELWVGGWTTNNVLRLDGRTGAPLGMFVPNGAGGLIKAHHFSFGPDGNFYVASYGTSNILRYHGRTGTFLDEFVSPGHGLFNAHTAFWNVDGTLLVSSENGNRVNQYDGNSGVFLDTFVDPGEAGLQGPEFIVVGPDDFLYLAAHSRRVLRLDPHIGGVVEPFVFDDPNTPGDETGGLTWAHGLRFGPDRNLYVASSQNHSILRYDGTTGAFIDAFVPAGSGGLQFPLGIAFGPNGHLYVASFNNSLLLKYDGQSGASLGTVANLGALGLRGPLHIEFLPGPAGPLGDLNCDGSFNGGDIDPFFLALGDPSTYQAVFPDCDPSLGDMNRDGSLNGGDIDPFFACLGGVCP